MQDIKKIASFIGKLNLQVDEIFHSGKLRKKQTAEVLADTLKVKVSETDELAPINNPEIWEDRLKKLINP